MQTTELPERKEKQTNEFSCLYFGNLNDDRPKINVKFSENISCSALIDSGATHSAISLQFFNHLCANGLNWQPSAASSVPPRLTDAQGRVITVHNYIQCKVQLHGQQMQHNFHVLEGLSQQCILGIDFIKRFLVIDGPGGQVHLGAEAGRWTTLPAVNHRKTVIPAGSHAKVLCQIKPPSGMTFIPGVSVLTHESKVDGVQVVDGICKVLERNVVYVVVSNRGHHDVHIPEGAVLTRVHNTAGMHGCVLDDTTMVKIMHGKAAAVEEIVADESRRNCEPLTEDKKKYIMENMNISQVPTEFRQRYIDMLLKNHDVFAANKYDLGWSDAVSHKINMKHERPIYVKQFPIPEASAAAIEDHVQELLRKHVLEECSSPYNTPIFAVAKKGGGLRVVQDFREINKASYVDKYAIRDVRQCIDAIGKSGSNVFSTLDLASGFWQQHLEPASRPMTAFTVPFHNKQYQWTRTSMGLQGAPASFSRLTAKVFSGDENSLTYVDDVLGHTRGHEAHLDWMEQAFGRLRTFNLKLNLKKCVFGAAEVTYLGFSVSATGVRPDKEKAEALRQFQPPQTVKQVREFVGFCNYFRGMVPHFHHRAAPLFELTKKTSPWQKGRLPQAAMEAFEDLRSTLASAPIISYPDFRQKFTLSVDAASGSPDERGGLGAVLTQSDATGRETIVGYWSRGLREHEKRYTPYNLEMLAVTAAIDHFHAYLFGRPFKVITDHKPLIGAAEKQAKTFSRLAEKLQDYEVEIEYRKGSQNQGPDYLSRHPAEVAAMEPWLTEQRKHPPLAALADFLVDKKTPPADLAQFVLTVAPHSFIEGGTLWYCKPPTKGERGISPVAWVPQHLVNDTIAQYHGKPLAGHWATNRTLQLLSRQFYWPTMARDVAQFIKACASCQLADAGKPRAHLQPWPAPDGPFQRIHIDLYGPLLTNGFKKHVLVMTDAFSKWVEVMAIENKAAPTVATALFHRWVCRYGCPVQIVSDGGKEFANQILDKLLQLMQTVKTVNSPYRPEANGQVERFNRDMGNYLRRMSSDTADWEVFLPSLGFAHNAAVNRSTGMPPFYLLFGRYPALPADLEKPFTSGETHPHELFRRLQLAHKIVLSNNEEARAAYKQYYDRKAKRREFKVGDPIIVHFPPAPQETNKKLHKPWRGIYTVAKVISPTCIEFVSSPGSKPQKTHTDRVKLFHMLTPPHTVNQLRSQGIATEQLPDSANSKEAAPTQNELEIYGSQHFYNSAHKVSSDPLGQQRVRTPPPQNPPNPVINQPPAHIPVAAPPSPGQARRHTPPRVQTQRTLADSDAEGEEGAVAFKTPPNSPVRQHHATTKQLTPVQTVAVKVFQPRLTRHSGLKADDHPRVLKKAI